MRSSVIQNNPEENVLRFRRREVMFLVPTKALRVFVKRFRRIRLFLIRREFLSETGTKINFRFRYRRKWILTRQKCPTDLKKILVGRLECCYPDGNEIHSRRLHFSNGNLFEQPKCCILHLFDSVEFVFPALEFHFLTYEL